MMYYKKLLPLFLLMVCVGITACGPNVEELNTSGIEKLKNEDLDGALEDFNKAIEKNPEDAKAYLNRGYVYISTGELQKVLDNFDKAIALDSGFSEVYFNRGVIYAYFEEYEKSIADFDKVIALNPEDIEAYINRALIHARLGDGDRELADLKMAARLGDATTRSWLDDNGIIWEDDGVKPDTSEKADEQKGE